MSITTKTDPALIDQGNLLKSDWDTYSRKDSQNLFGAAQFKNSVTVNSSLLSPTGGVNTIPPQYIKILRKMATMKTMATVKAMRTCVPRTYSIITNNNWIDAYNMQQTKHDTNDDVDTMHLHFNGRVAYMHLDCTRIFVPQLDDTGTLLGSSSERVHNHLHSIHCALSLTCPLRSLLLPLSSTTRSSWQTCAAPRRTRVRTLLTSSTSPKVMSPRP